MLNNNSIAIILRHGNNKFYFEGDAEEQEEDDAGQEPLQEGGAGQLAELGQEGQGHEDKGDAEAQGDEVEGADAVEAHFHQQVGRAPG